MKSVLVVDDNDKYANILIQYLQNLGLETQRANDAREGFEMATINSYSHIITDITMETQTSGLFLTRKLKNNASKSILIIATTGFDFPGIMVLGRYFLPAFSGVQWMVPKKPLLKGEVVFYPTNSALDKHPFEI